MLFIFQAKKDTHSGTISTIPQGGSEVEDGSLEEKLPEDGTERLPSPKEEYHTQNTGMRITYSLKLLQKQGNLSLIAGKKITHFKSYFWQYANSNKYATFNLYYTVYDESRLKPERQYFS